MKKFKKSLMALTAAVSIFALPFTVFADASSNVNVNANVNGALTPSSFALNFDSLSFNGDVGTYTQGTASLGGTPLTTAPQYQVTSELNFDVYVSGTDLQSSSGKKLNSRRIAINQFDPTYANFEGYAQVTHAMSYLYAGYGETNQDHLLDIYLDLTNTNNYDDNAVLSQIGSEQFTSQVTFSYSGI